MDAVISKVLTIPKIFLHKMLSYGVFLYFCRWKF